MSLLEKIYQEYGITQYRLSQFSGISQTTLQTSKKKSLKNIQFGIILAIAKIENMTLDEVYEDLIRFIKEINLEKLQILFSEFGFNGEIMLEELEENGSTSLSMEYDETPDLMESINSQTNFKSYLSPSTDKIIIERV